MKKKDGEKRNRGYDSSPIQRPLCSLSLSTLSSLSLYTPYQPEDKEDGLQISDLSQVSLKGKSVEPNGADDMLIKLNIN